MIRQCVRAIPALCLLLCMSASAGPVDTTLNFRSDWIGNTFSNEHDVWAQNAVNAIAVLPDGTVFANTFWDEGGAELSQYKDGKIVRAAMHTHGWGNEGGDAVAVNSKYVFAAAGLDNEGGHLKLPYAWPPTGTTWFGLTRRLRSDIQQGAPFEGGVGNLTTPMARSFMVINASSEPGDFISGLAADDHLLFVSNFLHNEVRVYDVETMKFQWRWPIQRPRKLAIDPNDGSIWVTSFADPSRPTIAHFTSNGTPLDTTLKLPPGAIPSDISASSQGNVIVADSGPAQQVYIFDFKDGRYVQGRTVGVAKGILANPMGQTGPLRFDGLTGAAMDAAGNLYVSMNRQGLRPESEKRNVTILGASVESYSPTLKLRWRLQAQAFVTSLTFDPNDPSVLWGGYSKFSYDYDKPPGEGWRYTNTLLNRFKYPSLPMNFRAAPFLRYLKGRPFLFTIDQNGGIFSIFRFDTKTDGSVAIPAGQILTRDIFHYGDHKSDKWEDQNGGIWRDLNGDGRFEQGEWQNDPRAPYPQSAPPNWWVDTGGDAWVTLASGGLRKYDFKGLDIIGNPIYDVSASQSIPLPAPFNRVDRLQYDAKTDQMFLSGYTDEIPFNPVFWRLTGPLIVRYDHWREGNRQASMTVRTIWKMKATPPVLAESFYVAGDYIFTINSVDAVVTVYSKHNGLLIGTMGPGELFGNTSGWIDMTNGVNAVKRVNGEYVVVAEEDTKGKFIVYRWTPTAQQSQAAEASATP